MKNTIEVGDQQIDLAVLDKLTRSAGPLHPRYLSGISAEYSLFSPLDKRHTIWTKPETSAYLEGLAGKCQNLIISLSGLPAGGKDAIREWIEVNRPGLVKKIITATTRPPRPGERHGIDYYFNSEADFLSQLAAGNLVEHSLQPTGYYGMPVASLATALESSRIALSHMEISGWPRLKAAVLSHFSPPPLVLSLFVLPHLPFADYASWWLPKHRPGIAKEKILRAAWELSMAASRADAFIINSISEREDPARAAGEATATLLSSLLFP